MSIQKLEMYKTSDGTVFATEAEATSHESKVALWDRAIAEYGRYGEVTFCYKDDFFQFLADNKTEVLRHLGVYAK